MIIITTILLLLLLLLLLLSLLLLLLTIQSASPWNNGEPMEMAYRLLSNHTAVTQTSPITCSVPKGPVLGPFLFNLYTDDLPNVINTLESTCIEMYADDTALYCIAVMMLTLR